MMKAVRYHGQRDIRLDSIPIPTCKPGYVKLKPSFAGICGSDLHEYLGGPSVIPSTNPHPITGEKVPITLGHEFSGIIEEVGETVTKFTPGDRVAVQPIIYDGTCVACKEGLINCCEKNGFVGLSGWGGGLSEHVVVPQTAVYKIPESMPMEVGALVEPLAVGWHAVNISPYKEGDTVLVIGGGPIGLCVIQSLRAKGAEKIIVSEIGKRRQQFAKDFGASHIVDPSKEDLVARTREISKGSGAHVVFDAAGVQPAMDNAVLALRARGTYVNIALWEKKAQIWPGDFLFRERRYVGVATYQAGDYQAVINAIEKGVIKPEPMITKKISIEQVEEGFKALIEDKDNQVKILIDLNT